MKSLVEELLEYFNNATEEQIKKDWNTIHKEYAYGVEVQEFIDDSRKLFNNEMGVSKIKINPSFPDDFGGNRSLALAA